MNKQSSANSAPQSVRGPFIDGTEQPVGDRELLPVIFVFGDFDAGQPINNAAFGTFIADARSCDATRPSSCRSIRSAQ